MSGGRWHRGSERAHSYGSGGGCPFLMNAAAGSIFGLFLLSSLYLQNVAVTGSKGARGETPTALPVAVELGESPPARSYVRRTSGDS